MNFIATELAGLYLIEPRVFEDARGWFMETYHAEKFAAAGIPLPFVQDNHSQSKPAVVRGLHYQIKHPQGKLVRCIRGEIYDVAVDLRRSSTTFGRWYGVTLSESNHRQIYVPPGFAHGFCALTEGAEITYKCTDLYSPQHERTLLWNDPTIGIEWPVDKAQLNEKDQRGMLLKDAECFE